MNGNVKKLIWFAPPAFLAAAALSFTGLSLVGFYKKNTDHTNSATVISEINTANADVPGGGGGGGDDGDDGDDDDDDDGSGG